MAKNLNIGQRIGAQIVLFEWLILIALLPVVLFPTADNIFSLLLIPCLWVVRKLTTGHFVVPTPLDTSLLLLLLTLLVSFYATFDPVFSLPGITGLLYGIAAYYAVVGATAGSQVRLKRGVLVYLGMGLAIAAFSVPNVRWIAKFSFTKGIIARLPQFPLNLPGEADGFHPNIIAGTLLWILPLFIILAIFVFVKRPHTRNQIPWLHLIIGKAAIVLGGTFLLSIFLLTQSRGGWLGFGVSMLFCGLVALRRHKFLISGLVSILLLLFVGLIFYLCPQKTAVLLTDQTFAVMEASGGNELSGRLEIWSRAMYGIQDFAFTGMGMNNFRRIAPELYPFLTLSNDLDVGHAHNHLLQAALDLGIPGLVAYLAVWLGATGMIWQTWYYSTSDEIRVFVVGFAACLLAYFVYGITDTVIFVAKPGFVFWVLLGLITGLHGSVVCRMVSLPPEAASGDGARGP